MDNSIDYVATPQRTLRRKIISNFKTLSKGDQIQNVLKIHHSKESNRTVDVDYKLNSVTTKHVRENENVYKTFVFDSILAEDDACEDILISAIKRVARKENSFILSVNKSMSKKSKDVNHNILQTLVCWLLEYLAEYNDGDQNKYSVRLSCLEIDDDMNTVKDLGSLHQQDFRVSLDHQHCYTCINQETFQNIIKKFDYNSQQNQNRRQYLYTINVYQCLTKESKNNSVPLHCSKIFVLFMDFGKQKSSKKILSPSNFGKLLLTSLNKREYKSQINTKLENILFDISSKCEQNLTMITQISLKEEHVSDMYHLLQLSNKIQRLKIKSKRFYNNKNVKRANYFNKTTSGLRNEEKYSDSEIASTSELSCVETVIFCGNDHRNNSDDESQRFRSMTMSSDSDSGYRDLKMYPSCESRGLTPVKELNKKIKTNPHVLMWPKSALKLAKNALLSGEEVWVDGPNAIKNFDVVNSSKNSVYMSSNLEKIKEPLSLNFNSWKPFMTSQEIQCDVGKLVNGMKLEENTFSFSDIIENAEDCNTLRKVKPYQEVEENHYVNDPSQFHTNRDDIQNLSNWISDVDKITSYQSQSPITAPCETLQSIHLGSVPKESTDIKNYPLYDTINQLENSNFPCMYPTMQYYQTNIYDPISIKCSNQNDESEKKFPSPLNTNKTVNSCKKKDNNTKQTDKLLTSKSFNPLELLKRTLLKKKKERINEINNELQSCSVWCPEISYLTPNVLNPDKTSDSSSSDSECNEWFRNVKSFKSKPEYLKNKSSDTRPPSAPLIDGMITQCSSRQRSNSSGYGSVITRHSEVSSNNDSTSEQSIQKSSNNTIKPSIFFPNPYKSNIIPDDLNPEMIAKRYEILVKQEKAFLLIQQQEVMVEEFYTSTRPLLTNDQSKYIIRISSFDINRAITDNQYLEELEEDTNIIRDSIAFYKSLIHLESSFITFPEKRFNDI